MLSWWDHYLKGIDNGVGAGGPRVDYFQMGPNTWHTSASWPPPGTTTESLYLGSGGHANSGGGDGGLSPVAPSAAEPVDRYRYDPANPVPSVGGHSCCGVTSPVASQGPYDQRHVEQRPDIPTYTTAPLPQDSDVTGPIGVRLWAASSAPDTDLTAKLVVVPPTAARSTSTTASSEPATATPPPNPPRSSPASPTGTRSTSAPPAHQLPVPDR